MATAHCIMHPIIDNPMGVHDNERESSGPRVSSGMEIDFFHYCLFSLNEAISLRELTARALTRQSNYKVSYVYKQWSIKSVALT